MENIQRSLEAGVSAYKQILHSNEYLNGAGAIESFLANKIRDQSHRLEGLEQYGFESFGKALEAFGKILLENAGLKSAQQIAELLSKNQNSASYGVSVFEEKIDESKNLQVYDNYRSKLDAIEISCKTACTILRIDQIILAKPAGGPKPKGNSGWDNDD